MAPFRYWAKRSVEEDSKQRDQGESAVRTRVRRVAKVVENAFSLSYRKEQQRQQRQQQQEEEEEEEQESQKKEDQQQDNQQQERQQEKLEQQPLDKDEGREGQEEKDRVLVHTTIDLRRSRTISAKEMNAVLQHREVIMERRLSLPLEHPRSISTDDGHTDHEDSDYGEPKPKARPESIDIRRSDAAHFAVAFKPLESARLSKRHLLGEAIRCASIDTSSRS